MKVLFEKEIIEARIEFLATQILNRHKSEKIPIVLVCVLNGGFAFYSKLAEKLSSLDPECDFVKVKSEAFFRPYVEVTQCQYRASHLRYGIEAN